MPEGFEQFTDALRYERSDTTRRVIVPYSQPMLWTGPLIVSEPWYYALEQGQTLDGTSPFTIARFLYAPAFDCRVSSQITSQPIRWKLDDFRTSRTLDLQDRAWTTLLPIVIAKLMSTKLLNMEGLNPQLLLKDAEDARTTIRSTPIAGTGLPSAVCTPANF
jgi:hypothetical protein